MYEKLWEVVKTLKVVFHNWRLSLGHAEQLLFSCLGSKLIYLTSLSSSMAKGRLPCHLPKCEGYLGNPWDMPSNFCFQI